MKPYQEKLLKLAGFAPQEYDGVIVWWHPEGTLVNEGYVEEGANCYTFNSLDWLEEWIMPAVRKEYKVFAECFYPGVDIAQITFEFINREVSANGKTKIEALNNALEELVNEAKPDK